MPVLTLRMHFRSTKKQRKIHHKSHSSPPFEFVPADENHQNGSEQVKRRKGGGKSTYLDLELNGDVISGSRGSSPPKRSSMAARSQRSWSRRRSSCSPTSRGRWSRHPHWRQVEVWDGAGDHPHTVLLGFASQLEKRRNFATLVPTTNHIGPVPTNKIGTKHYVRKS